MDGWRIREMEINHFLCAAHVQPTIASIPFVSIAPQRTKNPD
jgi:hypothetical protein